METVEVKGVDCGRGESPEAGPGVVKPLRPVGEPKSRQIESDAPQAATGQLVDHLAIQKQGRRNPVDTDHRLAVAVIEREARHPPRLEAPAGVAMMGDDVGAAHALPPTGEAHRLVHAVQPLLPVARSGTAVTLRRSLRVLGRRFGTRDSVR